MKNKKIISAFIMCVLCLLCFSSAKSQSGWVWQNPAPYMGSDTYSVFFLDGNTGWTTSRGKISKTTNGGISWIIQYNDSTNIAIGRISFLDALTGYSIRDANLLKTTNGGLNWSSITINGANRLTHTYFQNSLIGFVTDVVKSVYRTVDGGNSWERQVLSSGALTAYIKIFDSNEGILFTSPDAFGGPISEPSSYFKTTNGGVNWSSSILSPSASSRCAHFINMLTGWISAPDTIYKTTNGGLNWSKAPAKGKNLSMKFFNSQIGYTCSDTGKVYKTDNGGASWTLQTIGTFYDLTDIFPSTENNCLAVGRLGTMVRTTNGGANWTHSPYSFTLNTIPIVVAGNSSMVFASTYKKFHRSSDGGVSWQTFAPPLNNDISCLFFSDGSNGWISGFNEIKYTSDGGLSWEARPFTEITVPTSIFFINTSTGWITTSSSIYKTTNNGTNWLNYPLPSGGPYSKVFFSNSSTGWVMGTNKLAKTTDGGMNWVNLFQFSRTLKSYYFINPDAGWVSDDLGSVRKTINGGLLWDSLSTMSEIKNLYFANALSGWGIGGTNQVGQIYHTTNGGINWVTQFKNGEFNNFQSLSFLNSTTGWVAGTNGAILKTTTGGNVFISQISNEVPERYSLQQNYPNPFNPSTNIKFDIHKSGITSLKVFDLLGKEVETLVDEQLSVGTYEVTFNAHSLSSGIYFYVLKTGDFVESKRMVLVK